MREGPQNNNLAAIEGAPGGQLPIFGERQLYQANSVMGQHKHGE